MSFFSTFFTRKITYLDSLYKDKRNTDLLHVFGAIRVMPDEGDSFDIWRHAVINTQTYAVTNGIQQRGNDFEIESPFAQRAVNEMSTKLNRMLDVDPAKIEKQYELHFTDTNESDTVRKKKLPPERLHFVKDTSFENERYRMTLYKNDQPFETHRVYGDPEYFNHAVLLDEGKRLLYTYRKTGYWGMSGGMAFLALDLASGKILHDAYIK
ncbi:MAG: hypothetical protein FD123_178 [Bacteroidetes bacterium]|nr:MAG: hypothetical protein FD123_178 [Bacteroidota bacterium]